MLTDIQYRILKAISPGAPETGCTYEGKSKLTVLLGEQFYIREDVLEIARRKAAVAGVSSNCTFTTSSAELADVVVSVDAFEHFEDPGEILRPMSARLQPSGEIVDSFGPTWYHPMGGHLCSVFPWAHLFFSEKALIRWRSTFRNDGQPGSGKWLAASAR
jgi:hypothetical protein